MMLGMDLGPHAAIIVACYALVALVLLALIGWLVADGRRLARQLAALEERGIRRRSAQSGAAKSGATEPEANTRS